MSDPSTIVEHRDALEHLAAAGFSELLEALKFPHNYTKRGRGRVNLASLARDLKISPRRAAALLTQAREALQA